MGCCAAVAVGSAFVRGRCGVAIVAAVACVRVVAVGMVRLVVVVVAAAILIAICIAIFGIFGRIARRVAVVAAIGGVVVAGIGLAVVVAGDDVVVGLVGVARGVVVVLVTAGAVAVLLGAVLVGRVIVVSGVAVVAGLGVAGASAVWCVVGGHADGADDGAELTAARGRPGVGHGGCGPARGRGARCAAVCAPRAAAQLDVGQRGGWSAVAPVPRDGPQPLRGVARDASIRPPIVGAGGEEIRAPGGSTCHGGYADGM